MKNQNAVTAHFAGEWDEDRLRRWAETTRTRLSAPSVSLGVVFMTPQFFEVAQDVLEVLRVHARIPLLMGCSSQSLIANGEELENQAGVILQLFHFSNAELQAVHIDSETLEELSNPSDWHHKIGVTPEKTHGWIVFADPFHLHGESWLRKWNRAYPEVPTIGGLASGLFEERQTQLYLNGDVFDQGIVVLSVGGAVRLECVVSQGCTPIGNPWTVTKADENLIFSIANRPAYSILAETFHGLPKEEQERTQGNLFVGFASSEYCDEFRRGDFLIRNLIGADPQRGILAVGAHPRTGQTIQFHRRDAESATQDLAACLHRSRGLLQGEKVVGGILGICNGRGIRLFGKPNHDAGLIQELLGPLPISGFFCNGELGPVGRSNFLHGYTASLGLLIQS